MDKEQRPIDANALIEKFEAAKKGADLRDTLYLCGVQAVIESAPTIEPTNWTPHAGAYPLKNPEQCTFRVRSVKDGHGDTERGDDWCNGYQKSEVDDEPCLTCQACKLCAANDPEED